MNPLLNRLYQSKSRSKNKRSFHKDEPQSLERKGLVPKITTKTKLQSLPDVNERKKTVLGKGLYQKLPIIQPKQKPKHLYRHRKLSTTLKDFQSSNVFFTTQLELPKQQPEKQQFRITTKTTKRKLSFDQKTEQNQDQLFQYLKILEQNNDLKEEFCYMNRKALPYSFYIVEYDHRNMQQHLTVSLRGITYLKQGDTEFYTAKKLSTQIEKYRKMKQIQFFKDYLLVKTLYQWKDRMKQRKFAIQCKFLMSTLFSQNYYIQSYLNFLHSLSFDYYSGNFLNFKVSKTYSLKSIKQVIKAGKEELVDKVVKFDDAIESNLQDTLEKCLQKFRFEERVTIGTNASNENASFLPFDNKKRRMKYTQMAKLKQFQEVMYKLIKYTDMVRFNTKINMIEKCYINGIEEFRRLAKVLENRQTLTLISWINVEADIKQDKHRSKLTLNPCLQTIKQTFITLKQDTMLQIFRNHELFVENLQKFNIENIDLPQQMTTKIQLKYFIIKNNPSFELLSHQYSQSLSYIVNKTEQMINCYNNQILKIYDQSKIRRQITEYLQNQVLKEYLENYHDNRMKIEELDEICQYALLVVKMAPVKQEIKRRFEQKYKAITVAVPNQVLTRCESLSAKIKHLYNLFKQNPYTIPDYLAFLKTHKSNLPTISKLQSSIDELLELQEMIFKKGIRIGEGPKIFINQCQTYFRELMSRMDQITQAEEKDRKKFEKMIEDIVPVVEERSADLLTTITKQHCFNLVGSEIQQVNKKLSEVNEIWTKIKHKKQQLFQYQDALNLGHSEHQSYYKLQQTIQCLNKLWSGRNSYLIILDQSASMGFSQITTVNLTSLQTLKIDIQVCLNELQCYDLIHTFKNDTIKLLKIIKISKLLCADTLQSQHIDDMKLIIKTDNKKIKDWMFTKEGGRTITAKQLMKQTNVEQVETKIEEIVFHSKQENIIKKQLTEIEQYWKKTRIRFISEDIASSGITVLHLDMNDQLHEKLGYFLITLRNISSSQHAKGASKNRAQVNTQICDYLRNLLWKWQQVEKKWLKLLPLMTNCPAVKHQSNVYFQFTSVDTLMKKHIKQTNDLFSLRKVTQDINDKRLLKIFLKCEQDLIIINKTFQQFLENKRATYNRFYFLTDLELISILQNVKDAKSCIHFAKLCFNCEELVLQNELISGFKSGNQIFKLRKSILRGEPDQIFKGISQNMKISMKFMIRAMLPKIKVQSNIIQQLKQYPIQVTLVVDRLLWTQMSEYYLNTASYEDYQLVIRKPCESMINMLTKPAIKQIWLKFALRLSQNLSLKEIGEDLIRDQINSKDFKWKQQLRFYSEQQQISIEQFHKKIHYGCQYYPYSKLHIHTLNTTRLLLECFYTVTSGKIFQVNGQEGQGKRNMLYESGAFFGCYQKEVICNNKHSAGYLVKFVMGAILSGAWLNFYEFNHLKREVLSDLMENVSKSLEKAHPRTLFSLIQHNVEDQVAPPKIYGYNNYTFCEMDSKKICEMLLMLYRFKQYQELAAKIMGFLETAKPFFERSMGSLMSLMRRVVDAAGKKKGFSSFGIMESTLVEQSIKEQIIYKQRQQIFQILGTTLSQYFNLEFTEELVEKYSQKKQILTKLIQNTNSNLIILGQRSCKTTLIQQVLNITQSQYLNIFGESSQYLFTDSMMEYLMSIDHRIIVVYDGNSIIGEWNDLVTTGYLFLGGRKIELRNRLVMELRSIKGCTPSFIGQCQIVYLGQHILTKRQKIEKMLQQDPNINNILSTYDELFGQNYHKINLSTLQHITTYLTASSNHIHSQKSIHKFIIYILCILDNNQTLWGRHYSGKYTQYALSPNYLEPVSINTSKFQYIPDEVFPNYLYIPTRNIAMLKQFISFSLQRKVAVMVYGSALSGKSTISNFLINKLQLKNHSTTEQWSQTLKKSFTIIRKAHKNKLISTDNPLLLFVDDIDLGPYHKYHTQYLRQILQQNMLRDKKTVEYHIQDHELLMIGRTKLTEMKIHDRVVSIAKDQLSKESFQGIFRGNMYSYIKKNNISRQIEEQVDKTISRSLLIIHDDLTNIFSNNRASCMLLSVMKNLLCLSKKDAHISHEVYLQFYKSTLKMRLAERCLTKKVLWQIMNANDNMLKVVFNDHQNERKKQIFMFYEKHYKNVVLEQFKNIIHKNFPGIVVFDSLLDNVIYLMNQLESIDKDIVMLGRKGTGKKYILQIVAKMANMQITSNFWQAIITGCKDQPIIMLNKPHPDKQLFPYEQLHLLETDKQLQKYIPIESKQLFRQTYFKSFQDQVSSQLLLRLKKNVRNIFIIDQKQTYVKFYERWRIGANLPLCLTEQWPTEALINIFKVEDGLGEVHAKLFLEVNKILLEHGMSSNEMRVYEQYLNIYHQLYNKKTQKYEKMILQARSIHNKFRQATVLIKKWQDRIQILKEELKQDIYDAKNIIAANQLFTFALNIFHKQIKPEQQTAEKNKNELEIHRNQMQKKVSILKIVLAKIQKIVESFQRTQLSQLKKIYKNNKHIHFGLQCLCILLKQESSDQKSINKILADPNLLMKMKSQELLKNRNAIFEAKFAKQYQTNSKQVKSSTNQTAKRLLQWLNSITEYWRCNEEYKIQSKRFSVVEAKFKESQERHEQLRNNIEVSTIQIEEKNKIIRESKTLKVDKQFQLNSISQKIKNAHTIIPILKSQQSTTKVRIEQIQNYQQHLRGNCMLSSFCYVYLPLLKLEIKQRLLKVAKRYMTDHFIAFDDEFVKEITQSKISSMEIFNLMGLQLESVKVVVDPERKFLTFVEQCPQQQREAYEQKIIEQSQALTEIADPTKIYHTTTDKFDRKETTLVLDWKVMALYETQTIFMRLAQNNHPQYFQAKRDLEFKIGKNLQTVEEMKFTLYEKICESSLKILDDPQFVQTAVQLTSLEAETVKHQAEMSGKMTQIEQVTLQINSDLAKIEKITKILKGFREVNITLITDIAIEGQQKSVEYVLRWSLSNVPANSRTAFLVSVILEFTHPNDTQKELLRSILYNEPLREIKDMPKLKKSSIISSKNWQLINTLSLYNDNLNLLMQNVIKFQKEFEMWCLQSSNPFLPEILKIEHSFIQHLTILYYFKGDSFAKLLPSILQQYLCYSPIPFANSTMISLLSPKLPLLVTHHYHFIEQLCSLHNNSQCKLQRLSTIRNELEMKNIIWKAMNSQEWLILYDLQGRREVNMLENIVYYVINYDLQPGFRLVVFLDQHQVPLARSSDYFTSYNIQLNWEEQSYDRIREFYPLKESDDNNSSTQSLLNNNSNQSLITGEPTLAPVAPKKQQFSFLQKAYKLFILAHTSILTKYPQIPPQTITRIQEIFSYLQHKKIPLQFNISTISQYISKIYSFMVASKHRKDVQQTFDHIVDENKIHDKAIFGVPFNKDQLLDGYLRGNHAILGCQEGFFVGLADRNKEPTFSKVAGLVKLEEKIEDVLPLLRTYMAKLPTPLLQKTLKNKHFQVTYHILINLHNHQISKTKGMQEWLNSTNVTSQFLQQTNQNERMGWGNLLKRLSCLMGHQVYMTNIKQKFTNYIMRLRKQHQFLLYFSPSVVGFTIEPQLTPNLELLISSYVISYFHHHKTKDAYCYLPFFFFTKSANEKQYLTNEAILLKKLTYSEFKFNTEMKTLDCLYEANGQETAPIVLIKLKKVKALREEDDERLAIAIESRKGRELFRGWVYCNGIFNEWNMRSARLLAD